VGPCTCKALARRPRLGVRQGDIAGQLEQIGQRHARFDPCERRTEAKVNPMPECDVGIGISSNVEPLCMHEMGGVAVS
jgi:hypothetical protein